MLNDDYRQETSICQIVIMLTSWPESILILMTFTVWFSCEQSVLLFFTYLSGLCTKKCDKNYIKLCSEWSKVDVTWCVFCIQPPKQQQTKGKTSAPAKKKDTGGASSGGKAKKKVFQHLPAFRRLTHLLFCYFSLIQLQIHIHHCKQMTVPGYHTVGCCLNIY